METGINNKLLKGVKIVNVEGKDIKRGFSFNNKNKVLATYKFKGNFDFSLGLIELDRICKQKDIELYKEIGGKLYSQVLICLNFNYSNANNYNEIEKVHKQKNNMKEQFKESINDNKNNAKVEISKLRVERDELLKQEKDKNRQQIIRKEYKQRIKNVRLDRDITIKDTKVNNRNVYKESGKKLDNSLTKNGIREELYENNITVGGKTFIRFLRSSGSARIGKCIFILENVYEEMMEYALAGNEVIEDMEIDLPSYEAYLGLINTALEDIMVINPENILLVDDVDSKPYKEKCMVTKLVDGKLQTDIENYEVSNSLFDGSSLIDFSLLDEKYCIAGGVQIRNKWFKGFATACRMQQFFLDHNISEVSQLNGFTIAKDIKDIKFITTKSSIKYLKINKGIEGFKKWLGVLDNIWGICGHPHASKFVNGQYVQAHYQLLNNIQLNNPDEVKEVAKESLEYANLLKNDLEVFKMHIGAQIEQQNEVSNDEEYEDEFDKIDINDSNNFMLTMVKMNSKFANTKVFKDFRRETIDNFVDNCKRGHLLVFGCYAVVISNSIDYLYHAIDKEWKGTKEQSHMQHKSIMCDYFYKDYGKDLLLSRSPMPVQGNIFIAKSIDNKKIRTYFSYNGKMSPFIVHINAIESNYYERGSGYDNDGDKFLITSQNRLLLNAKKNYNQFLVPVNDVKPDPTKEHKYYWNNSSKCELDIRCSQNNIGRIINDSMILVSEYWHRINNGESHKNLLPLYRHISELSIMSNIAIDACKRPCPYDEEKELERIENCVYFREKKTIQVKVKDTWVDKNGKEHNKTYKGHDGKTKQVYKKDEDGNYILKDKQAKIRPIFFKLVGKGQDYCFQGFDCSMDFLQKIIKVKTDNNIPTIKIGDLLSDYANGLKTGKAQKRDIDKLIGSDDAEGILQKLDRKIKAIMITDSKKISIIDRFNEMKSARDEVIKELQSIRQCKGISDETLIAIIKRLDKDYSNKASRLTEIGRVILVSLFDAYRDRFIKMFKNGIEEVEQLVPDKYGNIRIFNQKYRKEKVKFFENENAV